MTSTLSFKIGGFEVSCTASEDFIKDELLGVIKAAAEVYATTNHLPDFEDAKKALASETTAKTHKNALNPITITTISSKLKVNSGSTLVLAACLSLHRSGKQNYSRKEITAEMKRASTYFKKTYLNNLSVSLKSLIDSGKLLEQTTNVYAIEAATLQGLEKQVG
jgi:hypothetical protein